MKRSLMGITLALALLAPATAMAASQKTHEQVMTLLRAPDTKATEADWKAIGPEVDEALREVALNGKKLAGHRARAVVALQYFKSPETRQALESLIADGKAYWVIRGRAARTLAISYQAEALGEIAPLLGNDEMRLREAAIKAVGLVRSSQSKQLLTSRRSKETSKYLVGLIDETLKRLATSDKEGK